MTIERPDNPEEEQESDPKGHVPLVYTGSRSSSGQLLFINESADEREKYKVPQFEVRDHEANIRAFIEYERTFGRGAAYDITHENSPLHLEGEIKRHKLEARVDEIKSMRDDYRELAQVVQAKLLSEEVSEVEDFIEAIKAFREKYPWLYDDVQPRKNFRIKRE